MSSPKIFLHVAGFIQKRPSGLYFRRSIPERLRSFLTQNEIVFSLRTQEKNVALVRAATLLRLSDLYFAQVTAMNHKTLSATFKAQVHAYLERFVRDSFHASENALLQGRGASAETLKALLGAMDQHLTSPAAWQASEDGILAELTDLFLSQVPLSSADDPETARTFVQQNIIRRFRELASQMMRLQIDPEFMPPAHLAIRPTMAPAPISPAPGPSLLTVWAEFVDEKKAGWKPTTLSQYQALMAEFSSDEFAGNKPINFVTREDILRFRNLQMRLPTHRKKKKVYRGLTVHDLCNMDIPDEDLLSSSSINEKLIVLSSFFNWCLNVKEYLARSITAEIMLTENDAVERAPYTDEDINKPFSIDHYFSNLIDSPFKYWFPLIALYSGARLGEIAQLKTSDFGQEDEVPVMFIAHRTKTAAGKRCTPIHPALVQLGLLDYVAVIRHQGHQSLFPDLTLGKERIGNSASKWFTRYRRAAGIKDADQLGKEKVFHSFRHTFITRSFQLEDPPDVRVIQQIVGHEKSIFGATDIYTATFPIVTCHKAVERLSYPVDIKGLAPRWRQVLS